MIKVAKLNDSEVDRYDRYLLRSPTTLFYASNTYRQMLQRVTAAQDYYLVARNAKDEIVGVMPAFILKNEKYGNILNSLPFFGSHGGMIQHDNQTEIKKLLLDRFYKLALDHKCIASTIVSPLFDDDTHFYDTQVPYDYLDERIGQLVRLPAAGDGVEDALFKLIDGARRRNIRKAIKNGITVDDQERPEIHRFLYETHCQNITSIGGIPKPRAFFEAYPSLCSAGRDYKLYTAIKDGRIIAALLLFYFNQTVEYFTPAIDEAYRSFQPLSLIIFKAMKDAAKSGYTFWNWGGTWKSQSGVYAFKKKWGSFERNYFYYTRTTTGFESILKLSPQQVVSEYPYFYVCPFSKLKIADDS